MSDNQRGRPENVQAESVILGAMMLEPTAIVDATMRLRATDFSLDSHHRIYKAMLALVERGQAVDLVTLAEELRQQNNLLAVGGPAYLASLTEGLPRNLSIENYVGIVKDKSLLRGIIQVGDFMTASAVDPAARAMEVLNTAESELMQLSESGIVNDLMDIPTIVKGSFGSVDNLASASSELTGMATHYTEFDRMTCGLQAGELIVIAARPSMGKTAWAINIAENAALQDGKKVAIFSLEMSKEALLRRMMASTARVGARRIQTGFMGREEKGKLAHALSSLTAAPMMIDDTATINVTEMRSKARRMKHRTGLDLIVVDYLQLMCDTRRNENRTQEVSAISRGLKTLAKELHVPVVALSQLSRESEKRGGNRRPILSDLRESGSIEQDADVVAFIHRESYYQRDEDGKEDLDTRNRAEIIVAKQRNGPTGTIHLAWSGEITRFDNIDTMH